MTIGSKFWPSPLRLWRGENNHARTSASAAASASTPEELAWERRWQAEWERRNVED
jgi:hypothetical protein